jgi:PLP dependent protein
MKHCVSWVPWMSIASNLQDIQGRIRSAAQAAGREPASVRLVAVSKTRPAGDVLEACRAGQVVFGENYVQELVEEVSRQWGRLGKCCDILVQVNLSGEATKSGTTEAEALQLVRTVSTLPHIRIRGLMTMPPFFDDPEAARPFFAELLRLSQHIEAEGIPGVEMRELSMGMSGDFEAAIQEGATLVRVGTSVFGAR